MMTSDASTGSLACKNGTLYLIVGSLGSGKQALVDAALAARPALQRAPIYFCDSVGRARTFVGDMPREEFERLRNKGDLMALWFDGGVGYGLPRVIERRLANGENLLISAGTCAIQPVRDAFPSCVTIYITARADLLRRRIAQSGEFTPEQIEQKITDTERFRPRTADVVVIDTSESIVNASEKLLSAIDRYKAETPDYAGR